MSVLTNKFDYLFDKWTISAKLGVMFSLFFILSLGNLVIYYFSHVNEYEVLIDAVGRNRMISQRIAYYSEYIANGDSYNQQSRESLSKAILQYNQTYLAMKDGGSLSVRDGEIKVAPLSKDLQPFLESIGTIWPEFKLNAETIAAKDGSKNFVFELLYIRDNVDALLNADDQLAQAIILKSDHAKKFGKTVFVVFLLLNTLVIVIYYGRVKHLIINRLASVVPYLIGISKGDLGEEMEPVYHDEIGELIIACNEMSFQLNFIVASITLGARKIAAASSDMSRNLQNVSDGANDQAANTDEISSAMEQMEANIQQNSFISQHTEKVSNLAATQINNSNVAVREMIDAMKKINQKVEFITDMAKQTNILALNAAVEAARAGVEGKGFAVVASEIRKLAEMSQVASKEIVTITEEGLSLALKSGKLLEEVVPNIVTTAAKVNEITASSEEMTVGSSHVNSAIHKLNAVTQRNAAAAQEMAATAVEFATLAKELTETISFFHSKE